MTTGHQFAAKLREELKRLERSIALNPDDLSLLKLKGLLLAKIAELERLETPKEK